MASFYVDRWVDERMILYKCIIIKSTAAQQLIKELYN
jgi:hypothetical protein